VRDRVAEGERARKVCRNDSGPSVGDRARLSAARTTASARSAPSTETTTHQRPHEPALRRFAEEVDDVRAKHCQKMSGADENCAGDSSAGRNSPSHCSPSAG
jgi:hypothetical protein